MNQPQPPQFTIAELGAKFGAQLGHAYAEIFMLEKAVQSFQSQIQAMTENEAALVDHIQQLEAELAELKVTIETLMAEPYRELAEDAPILSPELAETAAAGSAIIAEGRVTYQDAEKEAAALGSVNSQIRSGDYGGGC